MKDVSRELPRVAGSIPERCKKLKKNNTWILSNKKAPKIDGEREFGRVLLRARSGKKGRLKNLPESEGKKIAEK